MADLRGLIRFHRWQLDEKQRKVAELRGEQEYLRVHIQNINEQIRNEQENARQSMEATMDFVNYLKLAKLRRAQFENQVEDLERQIQAAADAIAEAFQEVKRYELAQDERDRQERAKQLRRENAMFDEVAVTGFMRQRKEEEQR
ncbi:Flagellar FliJ protein [uncultured Gammaproteobacteria bacterium]